MRKQISIIILLILSMTLITSLTLAMLADETVYLPITMKNGHDDDSKTTATPTTATTTTGTPNHSRDGNLNTYTAQIH